MQSPVDFLAPRCVGDVATPCRLEKLDGRTAPIQSIKYIDGVSYIDLCSTCSILYPNHFKTSKCYIPTCHEAGCRSKVGSEVKIERRAHMSQRVSGLDSTRETPVVDLTVIDTPSLSQPAPQLRFVNRVLILRIRLIFRRLTKGRNDLVGNVSPLNPLRSIIANAIHICGLVNRVYPLLFPIAEWIPPPVLRSLKQ